MRPLITHKAFNLAIDTLTCVWGGLTLPKLCREQLETALAPYPFLISFESSISADTHLDKKNYFAIFSSDERIQEIGINACCMVSLFAYESLKAFPVTIRSETKLL